MSFLHRNGRKWNPVRKSPEDVDTSMPNGRLVFGIFASIAEFERELIRSRVRSGLADAKLAGNDSGGLGCPWILT